MQEMATITDEVLAEMLTENTGKHMLDSGGAYGRHWQRNEGKTVHDFLAEPQVFVNSWGPAINLFHWLRNKLEYNAEIDAEFHLWCDEPSRKKESWFSCAYEWVAKEDTAYVPSGNTCNDDCCLLSQGFQCESFQRDGDDYILLLIHGGADVRGGYTKPRVFKVTRPDAFIMDSGSITIYSSDDRKGSPVCLDLIGNEVINVDDGQYVGRDDPLDKWTCFWSPSQQEGFPQWDEEKKHWTAPDGDGHIEFGLYGE